MISNYVVFCDNHTVNYTVKSTLFNLDNIVFTDILKNMKKLNPLSQWSDSTVDAIHTILKTLKSDSNIYHSQDFEIDLYLYCCVDDSILLLVSSNNILFPFNGSVTNFHLQMKINELNSITSYCFPESSLLFSKINNEFFKTIKKVDSFLDYNNELHTLIMTTGLSPTITKIDIDLFELEYDEHSINFNSTFKGFFESEFEMPFLKVSIHNQKCSIIVAGQMISLTEQEFLDTDNDELLNIIMRLLKFKKLPISSMSNLKDYLLIQDMKKI